jgi:3-phosphoshikimate 1-carboxyvinyltransferase
MAFPSNPDAPVVSPFRVEHVLIIGLGLIGGSLAKSLREKRFAKVVSGFDLNPDEIRQGLDLGVIDQGFDDLRDAVPKADLVVLAVPVKATQSVLSQIKPLLKVDALITDVGSTKKNVIAAAEAVFGDIPPGFVPGHPIAGSEKSGVSAADAALFDKHKVIVTPLPSSSDYAVKTVARMWQATGAEVLQMGVDRHDEVLAATSHLPHILAFSLVDTLAREQDSTEIFRYAAGGFRDFTRIAASDPTMWHDICIANKEQLLSQIDNFTQGLANLRTAIEGSDTQSMLGVFTRAKSAREHFNKMISRTAYSLNRHSAPISFKVRRSAAVTGRIRVPGDKSISHRAIMLGAIADDITRIKGFLESEDSLATLQAFRDMGVVIEGPHQGEVKIYGAGLHGLCPPPGPLYLGNSGTSMRLLSGLLAAQSFDTELLGDASLSKRPMARIADPLNQMGASIQTGVDGLPPVRIHAVESLNGMSYTMPVASAQVKSGVLLAGLYANGSTKVTEPALTRDHTERMLAQFGVTVHRDGNTVTIEPAAALKATDIEIPGDFSSAAFFIVAAAVSPGSDLTIEQVGINPGRAGLLNLLERMGANIELSEQTLLCGEPVANIRVQYRPLHSIRVSEQEVAAAIDEFPALFIAAANAEGVTLIEGLAELRFKESDRIESMAKGLRSMGIQVDVDGDQVSITGGLLNDATVNSFDDHRVAMALAIAGSRAKDEVIITGCDSVATSFPEFTEVAQKIGLRMHKEETHVST